MRTHHNLLLVAIMGAGKTVMVADIVRRFCNAGGYSTLVMVHRKNLVQQFIDALVEHAEIERDKIGIACTGTSKRIDFSKSVVVGSIQTCSARLDIIGSFDLVIIDECHTIERSSYKKTIVVLRNKRPGLRLIGLTATPFRMSGPIHGPKKIFPGINYKVTYKELVDLGYLMPARAKIVYNPGFVSKLDNQCQMSKVMVSDRQLKAAVDALETYCQGYKKVAVFGIDIDHCKKIHDAMIDAGHDAVLVHSQQSIHSKRSEKENIEAEKRFRNLEEGGARIMVSVLKLAEGWDFPPTSCIIMCRPTLSGGLWMQIVGRILRIYPGKDKILIVDLTPNTERFGLDFDNIPIRIQRGKKAKNTMRKCPKCSTAVNYGRDECPECGHVFPKPKYNYDYSRGLEGKKTKDVKYRPNAGKIYTVNGWSMGSARKPGGRFSYVKICYYLRNRRIYQNVFPEHPKGKIDTEIFWSGRGGSVPYPGTVTEFLNRKNELKRPEKIKVNNRNKYLEVTPL